MQGQPTTCSVEFVNHATYVRQEFLCLLLFLEMDTVLWWRCCCQNMRIKTKIHSFILLSKKATKIRRFFFHVPIIFLKILWKIEEKKLKISLPWLPTCNLIWIFPPCTVEQSVTSDVSLLTEQLWTRVNQGNGHIFDPLTYK